MSHMIADVIASPIDLTLTEPFNVAKGSQPVARNVLVRVVLDDGTTGLGEAAPFPAISGETQESALDAIHACSERLIGAHASSWRSIAAALANIAPTQPAARAGIEMAMLDAFARAHRMPLFEFFGGTSTMLETDMTVTAGDAAHASRMAREIAERGIGTIKVKVGAMPPAEDVERLVQIRRAAPSAKLIVDANGGYTTEDALSFLRTVERAGIALSLFEQPVSHENVSGMTTVARASRIPVCADESARCARDVLEIAKDRRASVINIKITKCGVSEALAMWSVARTAGLSLMVGEMVESALATSFHAHFAAGLGHFTFVDLDTPLFMTDEVFEPGYTQSGARMTLASSSVGHGASLRGVDPSRVGR